MRILIKLSAEALAGPKKQGFDEENALKVAREIKKIADDGNEVLITVGAGNLWRGRSSSEEMDRFKTHQIGIMGTIMNAMFMAEVFKEIGQDAIVQTPFPISEITKVFIKEDANKALQENKIVIFGGGIGQPFFSSDTAAILRSIEMDCNKILFAKNVDGVYDKDPNLFEDAKKFDIITYEEVIKNNLKVIDLTASVLASENNKDIYLFDLNKKDAIFNILNGKNEGTIIKK